MPLFLVRHAQAGSRADYSGPDDSLRPLTGRGRHQAADIAGLVIDMAQGLPMTIRTSPYRRCVETVAPLSAATGLDLIVDERLAEGPTDGACAHAREIAADLSDRAEVWCSHGDILPAVLEMLLRDDALDLGVEPRVQKGSIWVLDGGADGRYHRAVYLRPPC